MPESSAAVARVAAAFGAWPRPWGIAGGWALDAWRGEVSRVHGDVDVAVLREDQAMLRAHFAGWEWRTVHGGVEQPWVDDVALPVHQLVARRGDEAIEVLLNERRGDQWVYRRDAGVRRPLALSFVATSWGVPVLAPEIVLLYKAKRPRPIDEADFSACAGRLSGEARRWLAGALAVDHPWRAALA